VRDATDLADLLRMGRLPEAWIAPPATRELRELVRHRAKLVGLRTHCKAEVHAVLAKCGVQVVMSDLFGLEGNQLLDRLALPASCAARIASLRRVLEDLEFEIDLFHNLVQGRLRASPDFVALQQIPGIGPVLGAVFIAEVGDVSRFATAPQLACWAGLTPKHHESDTQPQSSPGDRRDGGRPQQGHLPRGQIPTPGRTTRKEQSDRRDRTHHPHHDLAHGPNR
jgi:transposase